MPDADVTITETETVEPVQESTTSTSNNQEPEKHSDLGEAGKKAIQRERDARADLERKLAEVERLKGDLAAKVKEFEDRDKSEQQELTDQLAELQKQVEAKDAEIAKATLASLRAEVAATKGVPANRLQGTTKEELEADADQYLAEVAARESGASKRNPPKTPTANLKSGASSSDNNGPSDKAKAARALRQLRAGA